MNLQLIRITNPFDRSQRDTPPAAYDESPSLARVVSDHCQGVDVVASINGQVVPKPLWEGTIIREGDQILMVPIVEGGGGGKNIFSMLGLIALTVASYGALGPGALGLAGLGLTGAALYGSVALVALAGGLLISAMTPVPKPSSAPNAGSNLSQVFGWAPQTMQQVGDAIPHFYGRNKLYGNVISAYTEPSTRGESQVLNCIIALGRGPIQSISDIRINGQPIESFDGVDYDLRYGFLDQPVVAGQNATKTEYSVSHNVTATGGAYTYNIPSGPWDQFEVDVAFPNGLFHIASSGLAANSVDCRIEYKRTTDTDWLPLIAHPIASITGIRVSTTNYKMTITLSDSPGPMLAKYGIVYIEDVLGMTELNGQMWVVDSVSGKTVVLAANTSFLTFTPYVSGGQLHNLSDQAWFITAIVKDSGNRPKLTVSRAHTCAVGDLVFIQDVGGMTPLNNKSWTVASKSSTTITLTADATAWAAYTSGGKLYNTAIAITDSTNGNCRRTYGPVTRPDPAADYQLRVTKLTADRNDPMYGDDLYVATVRTAVSSQLQYPRLAYVAIRALATENLNSGLNFSCISEGKYVRVWNGSVWTIGYSTNPAWVLYDVLTQPVFSGVDLAHLAVVRYDGMDPSRIDTAMFLELAEYCDEIVYGSQKRVTFNGGFDVDDNLWSTVMKICEVARCVPVWNGTQLTLAIDRDGSPVQLFTVGNISKDSFKETFLPMSGRATEIEINLRDADQDYERTVFNIVDPSVTASTNRISLDLFGITSADEAWRAGMFRLNQNRLLIRTIEFSADIDAIACTIGDLIDVQHDVPEWGQGGRIVAATANTITADHDVNYGAGTYQVVVRLSGVPTDQGGDECVDTILTKTVSGVVGSVVTVSSPFASTPSPGDVFAFGKQNLVTRRFRVIGINRDSDQRVLLTAIEYNASVYASDDVAPGSPVPPGSSTPADGVITNVRAQLVARTGTNGYIAVSWTCPASGTWDHAEIYCKVLGASAWLKSGDSTTNVFQIANLDPDGYYAVRVVSVGASGAKTDVGMFTLGGIDPARFVANLPPPPVVTGLVGTPGPGSCGDPPHVDFVWDPVTGLSSLVGYRIWAGIGTGFVCDDAHLVYEGDDVGFARVIGAYFYARIAAYDLLGNGPLSAEITIP